MSDSDDPWQSLSSAQAAVVEAVAARIVPSAPDGRGAREAGVVFYIDRTLDAVSPDLLPLYRNGVDALEGLCRKMHGAGFATLVEAEQDAVLSEIDSPVPGGFADNPATVTEEDRLLPHFFAVLREHTIQGMFGDPEHGGNLGMVGWSLIGFPGAQWRYTAEQMKPGFDARDIPMRKLADLRLEYPLVREEEQ